MGLNKPLKNRSEGSAVPLDIPHHFSCLGKCQNVLLLPQVAHQIYTIDEIMKPTQAAGAYSTATVAQAKTKKPCRFMINHCRGFADASLISGLRQSLKNKSRGSFCHRNRMATIIVSGNLIQPEIINTKMCVSTPKFQKVTSGNK
jgi:hypothetical protein